jgi:endonuclease/exonuclease/phosphatase family metal-dependent hydrolase
MNMKVKPLLLLFLFPFILRTFSTEAVENSVIPQMDRFEKIENLSMHRYSKRQFSDIVSMLERKDERIRVATYNILFDLYDHNLEEVNRWPQRLPRIVELIEEMQPDILGVQELYPNQLEQLMPYLENTFTFYARACEDGELNGIFYQKERFEVVDQQIWYMTETPEIPSSETLTMLQLKDLKTGQVLAIFNTHLAFSKIEKRDFQAQFIVKKIELFANKMPVILMGDMNTFPQRLDLTNLPFYDGDEIHRIFTSKYLRDAKEVSTLGHLGPMGTFTNSSDNGIPFKGTGTPGIFLDHIYVSDGIKVFLHAVQPGTVNGHFPSDHMPVIMDCLIHH